MPALKQCNRLHARRRDAGTQGMILKSTFFHSPAGPRLWKTLSLILILRINYKCVRHENQSRL